MDSETAFECTNPTCRRPTDGHWCELCEPIYEPFHSGDGPRIAVREEE